MAIEVDSYLACEAKDFGTGTSVGKGGRGGGKFAGKKGKLGTVEEGAQPDLVATMAEKKEVVRVNKEELGKGQEV